MMESSNIHGYLVEELERHLSKSGGSFVRTRRRRAQSSGVMFAINQP